ncbi:unnamed protein product [Thlaspi arvense]|uniref:glutathione transferase n=1 Tax=Thlaspi arvense TaxID=13288 RepID=A0AAU9S5A5_THLAR|nr:unnamed protein product [Thlaspi arvense]
MTEKKEVVKLLGFWASPFTTRVEMALKIKGVPYEYLEEDLPNKTPLLLELNPIHKKVPVLVHNDKIILESRVILEYIDQTWKRNPILPQDPYKKATARFLAKFVDEQFLTVGFISLVKAENGREVAMEETRELIMFLEKEVTGKDFFGGEMVGFLDIVAGSMTFCLVPGWEGMGIDMIPEEKFPELNRWIKNLKTVEAVRGCIRPTDKQIEHMNKFAEKIKSA